MGLQERKQGKNTVSLNAAFLVGGIRLFKKKNDDDDDDFKTKRRENSYSKGEETGKVSKTKRLANQRYRVYCYSD